MRWQVERCAALDSLEEIHGKITGRRRGRQYATEHLNLALFVSLAGEFQGFCRELHDEAAVALSDSLGSPADPRVSIFRNALVRGRKLDQGNAQPASLGADFQILGMTLWPDVHAAYPKLGTKWHDTLRRLNKVRNAIAHRNDAQLTTVKGEQPLNLATFLRWRRSLNGAAAGFDNTVGAYLKETAGIGWQA
ncbi:hypothetical protein AB0M34_23765 [Nocardia sp. NPDC050193]